MKTVFLLVLCGAAALAFLILFLLFQLEKEEKRNKFIRIMKKAGRLLPPCAVAAVSVSIVLYRMMGIQSIPAIEFTVILSFVIPVLISSFSGSAGQR